jgi:hypothetical protein
MEINGIDAPKDAQLNELKRLGDLKQNGVLTDAEFEAEKAKILHGSR